MQRLFVPLAAAIGLTALAFSAAAQPAFTQVRGSIQSVDAVSMTVVQNGTPTAIALTDQTRVSVLKSISVSAIQPGSFIGTTNVDKPDGTGTSTEVHVFPPGLRAGEGHYPMPGQSAMMTNGDVTAVVTKAGAEELDIKYSGQGGSGTRHVVVPPGTPIIAITPGDKSLLKAGIQVSVFAAPGAGGGLSAFAVNMGENGAPPPL